MNNMVVDLDLQRLSIPDRFFEYSVSYGNGAKALAEKMASDSDQTTWANAAVVLMLSAHSVELFLKGAIFIDNPKADLNHHNIESLFEMYRRIYREEKYYFNMPFKTEYVCMSEAEIKALEKIKRPTPSVLYRYPAVSGEEVWEGVYGFEALSFVPVISQLLEDYCRLRKCFT